MQNSTSKSLFDNPVLGHPQALFILFFTEMWERFSYYGMRALLVIFLISSIAEGGWGWNAGQALSLYGTYTSLVYLTPILGGTLADKYLGYRKAVLIGAAIMTLGHVSMAIESHPMFLFIGIGCLIVGNGFFKPNMTSMISNMYKEHPDKKDGAYTIFYMGVNSGAFLGIMLCGYIGESLGWSYGFGLAGIFMLLGMFMFFFSQKIFGEIGSKPVKTAVKEPKLEFEGDRLNPFSLIDKILMYGSALLGVVWIINDPYAAINGKGFLTIGGKDISSVVILTAVVMFLSLLVARIIRYPKITKDRMIVIVTFAVFMILYNASFEQAGGSMTIFAKQYTNRILEGGAAFWFNVFDILITVLPIALVTWVLYLLVKRIYKRFFLSIITLIISFGLIWWIVIWMINRNSTMVAYDAQYHMVEIVDEGKAEEIPLYKDQKIQNGQKVSKKIITIREPATLHVGKQICLYDAAKDGKLKYVPEHKKHALECSKMVHAKIVKVKKHEVEVKATWFGILNSLFIIMFAPLFSKWWDSKFNPAASVKYGIGLLLVGIGFAALAFGSKDIPRGAEVASVSMIWLVVAYLFHTLGELCLSPVSLSYVSKLVPARMIALMYGIWYIALAIGNKTAGKLGGKVEEIQQHYSISTFFIIFTIILFVFGITAILLRPVLKRKMHGIS